MVKIPKCVTLSNSVFEMTPLLFGITYAAREKAMRQNECYILF